MNAEYHEEKIRTKLLAPAQAIIDGMAETDRLSFANSLPQLVAETAPDAFVGDSTFTKERAEGISELAEAFKAWLQTPLTSGKLPIIILSQRD